MAKERTVFVCGECGGSSPKWLGRCPQCTAWNTLVEEAAAPAGSSANHRFQALAKSQPVANLADIAVADVPRTPSGLEELDRVLGGGIVPGGVVLIGGDPGIGKSTLLLQAADSLSRQVGVLYITGEESASQVALRARRLGLKGEKVRVMAEINLERILATVQKEQPAFCVIDSIQTVYSEQLTSAPGSVAQVRECAAQLTRLAKSSGTAVVLVGHVTKDGSLAGPRVLEHMGVVYTPDLSAGALNGITRDTILNICNDMGLKLVEKRITRDEVYIADEAFFTGTAAEVTPIRELDRIEIGAGSRGPITERIQSAFFDIVNGRNPKYASWLTPVN
ncbi:hypothetical protein B566_EDAN019063 [Ephemera danica]|nr:hypothetical protein B566_EDAN019063 [Ephemera danica]